VEDLSAGVRITLKWSVKDTGWQGVECADLAQDRFKQKGFVHTAKNLRDA
jgi:hypothetical protein